MPEALIKKVGELADLVQAVQDKNTSLEKKYDGLYNEQITDLSKKAADIAGEVEQVNREKADQQKRLDELEKKLARGVNGAGEQKSDLDIYEEKLLGYIRSGKHIDQEIAKKGLMGYLGGTGISAQDLEQKTMQVGINPQGGYWVRPDRLSKMVTRNFETSPMRSVATVITTASDHVELIIDDDEATSGGWVTETSTRTNTAEPNIGLLQIYTHEQYAEPKITQKLLDDAGFDVAAWLQGKINNKLGRTENTAFVSGDGAGKPRGILDYAAWASAGTYQRNALEQINSGSAAAITADGLISLQNSLQEIYQAGAGFMMKRESWGEVIKLKASTSGEYLIDPQILRNGAGQLLLLGKPVVFASDMPAIAAAALPIAYGNFGIGYHIVDKVGVTLIRDNITDKGRVKFYTSKRTGGAVTNYEAIKLQVVSA
ncbi:MAG: phage major capsid protein [Thermoplasmatales archaeon]|nr:MAG: phage major capsid protein [Thermoplasmatales archaeon]